MQAIIWRFVEELKESMSLHIPDFNQAQVLVLGDVMLDHYCYGDTSRISPEAPVPVVHIRGAEKRPGGAANVAMNIASLGAHTTLSGVVGDDDAGRLLTRHLEQSGVVCQLEPAEDFETITKMRILSRNQQLIRLDMEESIPANAAQKLGSKFSALLHSCTAVVLSDYGKGSLADCPALIQIARDAGCPVLVDPKGSDFSAYRGATIVTPNQSEFENVVGVCADQLMISERGENLRHELGLDALLITRGEHGMCLLQAQCEALHLPAQAHEVFDVTGAGDTVIGVLAASIGASEALDNSARLANVAAGLVVEKLGAATTTAEDLRLAISEQTLPQALVNHGVLDEAQLQLQVTQARARGERIVMTNGCFDLLHAGHVHYLREAARLGDRLLIAVNDDASVQRLKGLERPLNALQARMQVLAALEMVDWVIAFSEDTPAELIASVLPDVLVKGGDYQADEVAGASSVRAAGGRVEILEFLPGFSTSNLLTRARGESL